MSTETSELNQPNDGSDSDEPRRRFGFRHADTGVDEDGVDRDVVTTGVDDEDDTDVTGDTDLTGDTAVYAGADPQTLADTVATPIEEQVNGVEHMQSMVSASANDGTYTLQITFEAIMNAEMHSW